MAPQTEGFISDPADPAMQTARRYLEASRSERLRELGPALPHYLGYLLFHLFAWPYLAYRGSRRAKRYDYKGIIPARLFGGTPPPPEKRRWIVIQSTDIGETRTALLAAAQIRETDPMVSIGVVVSRAASLEFARKQNPPFPVGVSPFNNPLSDLLFLIRWRPSAILMVDHNYNYHLAFLCRLLGVRTVMVNVFVTESEAEWKRRQASDRSAVGWRHSTIGAYAAHSEAVKERVVSLGAGPESVVVTGPPLPMALPSEETREMETARWRGLLAAESAESPILVAGSVHADDEAVVWPAFSYFQLHHPDAILVLAPRKLERAAEVKAEAETRGFSAVLRSQIERRLEGVSVVIMDTMGELKNVYSVATVAYVGGTFNPDYGGHTPGEPMVWGVPITVGPCYEQQRAMVDLLNERGALAVCPTPEELCAAWENWQSDPFSRHAARVEMETLAPRLAAVFRTLYTGLLAAERD